MSKHTFTTAPLTADRTVTWPDQSFTVGPGGSVLLESHTASASATLDFATRNAAGQSGVTVQSDYDEYLFEFINVIPATDNALFHMRMGTGGGPTYDTGNNYNWTGWRYFLSGSGTSGTNAAAFINLHFAIDTTASANWSFNGSLRVFNPGGALYKQVKGSFSAYDNAANNLLGTELTGAYVSTTAVTAFQFFMSTGNIASGTIRVYGIAK